MHAHDNPQLSRPNADLVVISELLSSMDVMLGINHNMLVPFHSNDLGVAVGVTAVIDEACQATLDQSSY